MDDDQDPKPWTVRRRGARAPSPAERILSYAIPAIICALLGAGLLGYMYASGGPGRTRGKVARAAEATKSGLLFWASLGALSGAGVGVSIARSANRRGGSDRRRRRP